MAQNPSANPPQPQKPRRGSGFVNSFKQSNWITDAWNWFMVFAGKAAEPVLIISVLYSSAKLLPALQPYLNANLDATVFIAQFVALDVGGLSLNKMANLVQATNPKGAKQAKWLSIALVVIMISGVILASLAPIMAKAPQLSSGIDTFLLICRAILAVLYSRVIHSLKGHDDGSQGHGGSGGNGGPGSQPPTPFDPDAILREVHEIVNQAVNQSSRELAESLAGSQQQLMNQASRELAESLQGSVNLLEQRISSALAGIQGGYSALESGSPAGQLRLLSSGGRTGRSSSRQFVEALPARTQAGSEVQGRAMLNSQAGHGQATYEVQGATALNLAAVHETTTDKVHAVTPDAQPVNLSEVHGATPGQFMNPGQVQSTGTRVSREQVIAFVVNYWTTNGSRPQLKTVMDGTGCSKGQASQCINQVAPQFGGLVVTEE